MACNPLLVTIIKMKQLLISILCCTTLSACLNFYKAVTVKPSPEQTLMHKIDSLKLQQRYFILRNGYDAYCIKNIQLSADKQTFTCRLDTLSDRHMLHLNNGLKGLQRYKKHSEDEAVLNEVHLFIQPDSTVTVGSFAFAPRQVQKIEVIQKDKKRTTNSYVVGAVGFTIASAALITAFILATKSSCPFVSAYDGNQYTLQGEIFGGAIYPQLARHDYLPLKMAPAANGALQLKISNELKERQYTDMANLLVITHSKNTSILSDEKGILYSIASPHSPESVWLNNQKLPLAVLEKENDDASCYMNDTSFTNGHNELRLQFSNPSNARTAKLVLSLKNSYWLDFLYGELAKGFGKYYPAYIKKQHNKPASELLKWVKDQQIPLEVRVKNATGWQTVTAITTIGPVATRQIVVPVDIPEPDAAVVEIKLSAGFMFWEIDYAGIDFSNDNSFTTKECLPVKATDELNKDVLPMLLKEDGLYLEQPEPGNTATIVYNHEPLTDTAKTQTCLLHTKGYYTHVRHFKGGINKAFLKQFKKPGAFTAFSIERFKQLSKSELEILSKK